MHIYSYMVYTVDIPTWYFIIDIIKIHVFVYIHWYILCYIHFIYTILSYLVTSNHFCFGYYFVYHSYCNHHHYNNYINISMLWYILLLYTVIYIDISILSLGTTNDIATVGELKHHQLSLYLWLVKNIYNDFFYYNNIISMISRSPYSW